MLAFVLLGLGLALRAAEPAPPPCRTTLIYKSHTRFADAFDDWTRRASLLSPASPDYASRLYHSWYYHEVPLLFACLEKALVDAQ